MAYSKRKGVCFGGRWSTVVQGGLWMLDGGEGDDIMKRVRSTSDGYGVLEDRYEYDAFGVPYQGDLTQGMNLAVCRASRVKPKKSPNRYHL
jgi:hypothetical protein